MDTDLIKGDLIQLGLEGEFDVIIQGCNCWCTQGSGLAAQMVKQFQTNNPKYFPKESTLFRGNYNKLGCIDWAYWELEEHFMIPKTIYDKSDVYDGLAVVNCYTQFYYAHNNPMGRDAIHVDYMALVMCMKKINHIFKGKKIGVPMIGAGLANGNWDTIRSFIERELTNCKPTIVEYDK